MQPTLTPDFSHPAPSPAPARPPSPQPPGPAPARSSGITACALLVLCALPRNPMTKTCGFAQQLRPRLTACIHPVLLQETTKYIYIYRASDACNYGDISNTRLSNIPGIELQFTYIEIPLLFLLLHMTSRQRRVQKSRPAEPLHAAEVRDRRSEVIS